MRIRILQSVMLVLAMSLTASADSIVANFDGGNSTTVADAYTGMAGNGWAGPWVFGADSSSYITASAVTSTDSNFQELKTGSGNYLHVEIDSNTDGTDVPRSVSREYKSDTTNIDWTQAYNIDFTIRIDEEDFNNDMNSYRDRYVVVESGIAYSSSHGGYDSAFIMATGTATDKGGVTSRQWAVCPGSGAYNSQLGTYIGTGVPLVADGVYDITFTIDPTDKTWDLAITDGTNSFSGSDYPWRKGGDAVGGFITFAAMTNGIGDVRSMSVDNVVVSQVPEPSTLVGLFILLTTGGCCLRKNRK